jgi:adenylate kinase family enzyme
VGPTGSGKTPLGDHLEKWGWRGRRCRHFDFGARLRAVAGGRADGFTGDEVAFVSKVLQTGALLENDAFHLAEKILRAFLEAGGTPPGDLLIMNGLPRHVGQAEALDDLVAIDTVVQLDCRPEVVLQRLRLNPGGDRTARADDHIALVEDKLRIFSRRTAPLLAHYGSRGAEIRRLRVEVASRPQDLLAQLG